MTLAFLQSLIDLLTGSVWTYPILFGICVGDALIPAFPSETAVIVCGIQAARGQLSLELVIACAAAGAFVGDNLCYAVGRWLGTPAVERFFRRPMFTRVKPEILRVARRQSFNVELDRNRIVIREPVEDSRNLTRDSGSHEDVADAGQHRAVQRGQVRHLHLREKVHAHRF